MKIPSGGDILGKERGKKVQRCLWFAFGVGFFFLPLSVFQGKRGNTVGAEPSLGNAVADFDPSSEQSPALCHGVGPAERVKNGVVFVCVYLSAGLLGGLASLSHKWLVQKEIQQSAQFGTLCLKCLWILGGLWSFIAGFEPLTWFPLLELEFLGYSRLLFLGIGISGL